MHLVFILILWRIKIMKNKIARNSSFFVINLLIYIYIYIIIVIEKRGIDMKKKILLVMLCTLCLLKTTGCGKEKVKPKEVSTKTDKEIYLEVVDGKKDYVNTDNQSQNISKYLEQFKENGKSTISYTMVDLDNDKKEEIIVLIENNDGYYLILNIENNKVYGFEKNYRDMTVIKKRWQITSRRWKRIFWYLYYNL